MTDKPKLDTFIDRIQAVMLDAGVEPKQLRATMCAICDIESVSHWFLSKGILPPAEYIAALSVYFRSDCVWLITGKYSSEEVVCDRHDDKIFSCTLANQRLEAKDVKIIRNYED